MIYEGDEIFNYGKTMETDGRWYRKKGVKERLKKY